MRKRRKRRKSVFLIGDAKALSERMIGKQFRQDIEEEDPDLDLPLEVDM